MLQSPNSLRDTVVEKSTMVFRWSKRHFWVLLVFCLTWLGGALLAPSQLKNRSESTEESLSPEELIPENSKVLAQGIPTDLIPDYSIDQFQYVSTKDSVKEWKMLAQRADFYPKQKIVHSKKVKAYLYDNEGKITEVESLEGKYLMSGRDLELYGRVLLKMPDGFQIKSDYLKYRPADRRIEIPAPYLSVGAGKEEGGQNFEFESVGLDYPMQTGIVHLQSKVWMYFESSENLAKGSKKEDPTAIISDRALMNRNLKKVNYTMLSSRPLSARFVQILQPKLYTRSRRAELFYGDGKSKLNSLIAYEDVYIRETEDPSLAETAEESKKQIETAQQNPSKDKKQIEYKYATSGRAEFDAKSDVIRLTEFPQVYQDADTVTGEVILMHRQSDLIEVEFSNGFNQNQ